MTGKLNRLSRRAAMGQKHLQALWGGGKNLGGVGAPEADSHACARPKNYNRTCTDPGNVKKRPKGGQSACTKRPGGCRDWAKPKKNKNQGRGLPAITGLGGALKTAGTGIPNKLGEFHAPTGSKSRIEDDP